MTRIHCSVANYHYWKSGNICDASEIMVTSDKTGTAMPNSFDAPRASNASQIPVSSRMKTCCKTFVQTGSGYTNAVIEMINLCNLTRYFIHSAHVFSERFGNFDRTVMLLEIFKYGGSCPSNCDTRTV